MGKEEHTAQVETRSNRPSTASDKLAYLGLALLGLALMGSGIGAMFTIQSDAGAAALLATGTVLVPLRRLGDETR